MNKEQTKAQYIAVELAHHLPFSIFGVVVAIIVMGFLTFIAELAHSGFHLGEASGELFHVFHPFHVLFSAITTTAMFWKHDNHNPLKAVLVGFFGSVAVCGISDIFVPYIGGIILGSEMHLHVCLIEEPMLVYPFAVLGILAGFAVPRSFDHSTQYSHSMHVFLSSMASLLYLIGFGLTDWMHVVTGVFFVTVVAVMFPCCLSDIVFPLACTHKFCKHPDDEFEVH